MMMLNGFDLETRAHMLGMAAPGERVRFLNRNGYPRELENCREHFVEGQELTVADLSIGGWTSSYQFNEVPGKYFNTVCFEPTDGDAHA